MTDKNFRDMWKTVGWLVYLALTASLFFNLTIGPFLSEGNQIIMWAIFFCVLIYAVICSYRYHRDDR